MILSFEIQHYRSCRKTTLRDLTPIVALLGRNGVGKSNLLRAIKWFADAVTGPNLTADEDWRPDIGANLAASLRFSFENVTYKLELTARIQTEATASTAVLRPFFTETLAVENGQAPSLVFNRIDEQLTLPERGDVFRVGSQTSALSTLKIVLPSEDAVLIHVDRVIRFLSAVRYYGTNDINPSDRKIFLTEDEYIYWANNYRAQGIPGESVLLRLLHMYREQKEKFEELKSLLGTNGLQLISEIPIHNIENARSADSSGKNNLGLYLMNFVPFDDQRRAVTFNDLSFGTQRLLRILTSLAFDDSSVLLIEQPEDGIHAGLTRKLFSILRSYSDPAQIIVATHSIVLMNLFEPQELRLITKSNQGTIARPLTAQERSAAANYLSDDGTLGE